MNGRACNAPHPADMETTDVSEATASMHTAVDEKTSLDERVCASRARSQLGATEKIFGNHLLTASVNQIDATDPLHPCNYTRFVDAVQILSRGRSAKGKQSEGSGKGLLCREPGQHRSSKGITPQAGLPRAGRSCSSGNFRVHSSAKQQQ